MHSLQTLSSLVFEHSFPPPSALAIQPGVPHCRKNWVDVHAAIVFFGAHVLLVLYICMRQGLLVPVMTQYGGAWGLGG